MRPDLIVMMGVLALPPGAPPATVQPEVVREWSYRPTGRDPFAPFVFSTPPPHDRGPAQRYDVDQYRLVGVVLEDEEERSAMVEDPSGEGHVLRVGSDLGRGWGKVTSIEDGFIVVTEEKVGPDGDLFQFRQTLALPRMK